MSQRPGAPGGSVPPRHEADADLDWAAALAGRPATDASTDAAAHMEAACLRQALRRWPSASPELPPDLRPAAVGAQPGATPALARLLAEAERQGLLARPPACAACQALKVAWARLCRSLSAGSPSRHGRARGHGTRLRWRMGAGLVLAGVLGLAVLPVWLERPADGPTLRQGEPVQRRSVAQPRASRDALADRLGAAGADVQRYERAGRFGLDAEFSTPPDATLQRWLVDQGLALAPDGSLRVEFGQVAR